MLALLAALLLSADASSATTACQVDDDCTITHRCACDCCPSPPEAMNKKAAAEVKAYCSRVGPCAPPEEVCAAVKCTKPQRADDFRAACHHNVCIRVSKSK